MLGLSRHCDKAGEGKWKKKPFLSVIHFASNSPSLCAAIASKKMKGAKTKQKSRNWQFAGFLFISFLIKRKPQTIIFLKLPVHMYTISWFINLFQN